MMRFLGTGAAETLPNPFCDCPVCTAVRRDGRAYHKRRSCFRVNEEIMVDFGPDVIDAAHEYGEDFCGLRHILFTHSHDDHLSLPNLSLLGMSQHRFEDPTQLWFSPEAFAWVCANLQAANPDFHAERQPNGTVLLMFGNGNAYLLRPLPCNTWLELGEVRVKAVRSSHPAWGKGELAWNYLFDLPDGRRLLYACDTGVYAEQTLHTLDGEMLDILILECTFGSRRLPEGSGHLDAYTFVAMLETMLDRQIITPATRVYSTHLNHKHTFTPLRLQEYFNRHAPLPVCVARDGDVIL